MGLINSAVSVASSLGENSLVSTITLNIFPFGRIVKVTRTAVNITNSTNPVVVTLNVTKTVLECCAPPPLRLAVDCVALGAGVVSTIASPNPISVGVAAHFVGKIYDEC